MPAEPEGIKPVMFLATVLYLMPPHSFKPRALFTNLSLSAKSSVINRVWSMMSFLIHLPANVITVFGYSVAFEDALQI
jgi:hypothetical protein